MIGLPAAALSLVDLSVDSDVKVVGGSAVPLHLHTLPLNHTAALSITCSEMERSQQ